MIRWYSKPWALATASALYTGCVVGVALGAPMLAIPAVLFAIHIAANVEWLYLYTSDRKRP